MFIKSMVLLHLVPFLLIVSVFCVYKKRHPNQHCVDLRIAGHSFLYLCQSIRQKRSTDYVINQISASLKSGSGSGSVGVRGSR